MDLPLRVSATSRSRSQQHIYMCITAPGFSHKDTSEDTMLVCAIVHVWVLMQDLDFFFRSLFRNLADKILEKKLT